MMREQIERSQETGGPGDPDALASLLAGSDTWTVS
jgi:hypothetical protein